jgi:XTP/dITP diphosphohydrolase
MTTPVLLLATTNAGKLRELRALLPSTIELRSLREVGIDDLDEPADDYAANAISKALAASRQSGLPSLADDSGIAVDALSGAPGAYSARFGGIHGDSERNRALLLQRLVGVTQRSARFRCAMAFADVNGPLRSQVIWRHGDCAGTIAHAAMGDGGFGYDPIFVPENETKTMAQLSEVRKNAVSHRARALQAILPVVIGYLATREELETFRAAAVPSEQ